MVDPGGRPRSAARYARAIERLLAARAGRAVVLSPRDWSLIAGWHAARIPLQVVDEALASLEERRRKARARPGALRLASAARAVEQAWSVVLQGRLRGEAESPESRACGRGRWEGVRRSLPDGSPLSALLDELLARLESGERKAAVDAALTERIASAAPVAIVRSARADVDERLEPFRTRMDPERFERTARRALADALRRRLGLPGL